MNTAELYQQVILEHNKHPRHWGLLEHGTHRAEGHNPLCGDRYTVTVRIDDDGVVQDIGFDGAGCAISKASASLMTEAVIGKRVEEVTALFEGFHDLVTRRRADALQDQPAGASDGSERPDNQPALGKLEVFSGVSAYPARVKCAILSWRTLEAALEEREQVTTE